MSQHPFNFGILRQFLGPIKTGNTVWSKIRQNKPFFDIFNKLLSTQNVNV